MAARLESTNEKIVEILKTQLPKNLTLLGSKYRCSNGWYCGKPRKCRTRKIPLESLYIECYLARIQFFCSKFDPEHGQLAPQMKLLKLALLCNPVRLREITPSPEQLINLPSLRWSAAMSLQFRCNVWRMNCQCSGHLLMTSMPTYLIWSQFFLFSKS